MKLHDLHELNEGEVAYIVYDESIPSGDDQAWFFTTVDEANDEADAQWRHLTPSEQKHRHVWVGMVKAEECEDGVVSSFSCVWGVDGAFDSNVAHIVPKSDSDADFELVKEARQFNPRLGFSEEGYIVKYEGDLYFIYLPAKGYSIENSTSWLFDIERHWCFNDYDPDYYTYFDKHHNPLVLDEEANG